MTRFLVSAIAAGLFAGAGVAGEIKSGPAPGEGVTPFNPVNVAGPYAGTKSCPV
jgi:hypothetical protein